MQIAVASGKGGTGKTTIATSLAKSMDELDDVWYVDCDVEEPNGHLFLKPAFDWQSRADVLIPQIQMDICTSCGTCVDVCQFHALAKIGKKIMVFPQLCHGCGSCTSNCPEGAIKEVPNPIGVLEAGMTNDGLHFLQGKLTVSEPMPTPIIRQLKRLKKYDKNALVIFDSPPGASCSVVETLRGADFALLVTEPTPFGLHDLKQMIKIVNEMGIPSGIIINRDGIGDERVDEYLEQTNLPVLMRIPYDRTIASGIAQGKTLVEIYSDYRIRFKLLFQTISSLIPREPSC